MRKKDKGWKRKRKNGISKKKLSKEEPKNGSRERR